MPEPLPPENFSQLHLLISKFNSLIVKFLGAGFLHNFAIKSLFWAFINITTVEYIICNYFSVTLLYHKNFRSSIWTSSDFPGKYISKVHTKHSMYESHKEVACATIMCYSITR